MTERPNIDILGLGAVTIDDLIYVDEYPPADAKIPVQRSERHCGGLTGTALVAAARLGLKTAYAGVLGVDDLSNFLVQCMADEGVDMTHARRRPGVYPIHAFIVVDENKHTRNVFVDLSGESGADAAWPPETLLRSTRVLFVDHIGVPGMIRAARICRAAGIPIVADFERSEAPAFTELLSLIDHLILSQSFATKLTGEASPAIAARALWTDARETVIITGGSAGCWFINKKDPLTVCQQRAFKVEAVDTTGCGDVFHGAYAAGLADGLDVRERIVFASAAAALKATRPGGQTGIPTRDVVKAFLSQATLVSKTELLTAEKYQ